MLKYGFYYEFSFCNFTIYYILLNQYFLQNLVFIRLKLFPIYDYEIFLHEHYILLNLIFNRINIL